MSDPITFGTDGWRAVIADKFTFANVERVSQAYATYIRRQADLTSVTDRKIVVGYDRRFLSREFSLRVAEVLSGNDLTVQLFEEDIPTPLISWGVRFTNAFGGVIVTASHNPPEFNGFKIKAPWGGSAPATITRQVEGLIDVCEPLRGSLSPHSSSAEGTRQMVASYRDQIADHIDLERIRSASMAIVVDPMHGTGGRWVESFLRGGTISVNTIRSFRDPNFGGTNPEPIDGNLSKLKDDVLQSNSIIGLATDGDADRIGVINELGKTMTMHEVVPLILVHLVRNRRMKGGVVTTFSQSVLVKRIASAFGLPLFETQIGFKYIAEHMLAKDILIGAEESGGIGVKGHIPERDGILNSLLMLESIVAGEKPPSELIFDLHKEFGCFHYDRIDLRTDIETGSRFVEKMTANPPGKIAGFTVKGVETLDGTKLIFEDESWLLFRQSGTEPVLRIYSEATSPAKVRELLEKAVNTVRSNTK